MTKTMMARAFNAWMKEYTEDPAKFEREWETVGTFLKEQADGVEPSYGAHCAEILERYAAGLPQVG